MKRMVLPWVLLLCGACGPEAALHWSPGGTHLLLSWMREGPARHAVIDTRSGHLVAVPERVDDLWVAEPFGWIDAHRALFTAHPSFHPEQGPLGRGDLAVFDLRDRALRRVTSAPDGVFLRPLAPWGADALLVGEVTPQARRAERFHIFEIRSWTASAIDIPPADRVIAHSNRRALLVTSDPLEVGSIHRVHLWEPDAGARPLLQLRGTDPRLFWSPEGRRIAVSISYDEPTGSDSFRTRYATWVLE
jgi:hypothetical protein